MMSPAFAHRRIAEYAEVITERTVAAEGRWKDGERLDFAEEMMRLTLDIVGKTLFDAEVGARRGQGRRRRSPPRCAPSMANINSARPAPAVVALPAATSAPRSTSPSSTRSIYRLIRERRADQRDHGDFLVDAAPRAGRGRQERR